MLRLATHTDDGSIFALVHQDDSVSVQIVTKQSDFDSGPSSLARYSQATVCVGTVDDDSSTNPQYNLNPERLAFISLLATHGPRTLVVLPVIRLGDEAS